MSKAKTAAKVLKTAIKRIATRFTQGQWCARDDQGVWRLCMEGALFNGASSAQTVPQAQAKKIVEEILKERGFKDIPTFNDQQGRTADEAIEIFKLALIRIETGGLDDPEDEYIDDGELEKLLL